MLIIINHTGIETTLGYMTIYTMMNLIIITHNSIETTLGHMIIYTMRDVIIINHNGIVTSSGHMIIYIFNESCNYYQSQRYSHFVAYDIYFQ